MQSPDKARTRMEVYAIKLTLLGTSPPVWRRILVPRDSEIQSWNQGCR